MMPHFIETIKSTPEPPIAHFLTEQSNLCFLGTGYSGPDEYRVSEMRTRNIRCLVSDVLFTWSFNHRYCGLSGQEKRRELARKKNLEE